MGCDSEAASSCSANAWCTCFMVYIFRSASAKRPSGQQLFDAADGMVGDAGQHFP
jgi:hypothetical protein